MSLTSHKPTKPHLPHWKIFAYFLLSLPKKSQQEELHQRLFPGNDEYDPAVLDANNVHGTPYGGYSRATRSRLASLPLKLPNLFVKDDETTSTETHYWETADGMGRRHVCRIFTEDALESSSLSRESLFDPPINRLFLELEDDKHRLLGERLSRIVATQSDYYSQTNDLEKEGFMKHTDNAWLRESEEAVDTTSAGVGFGFDFDDMEIEVRLDLLDGLCIQKRMKYWTYEWCWEDKVQKFRTETLSSNPKSPSLKLKQVSNLGYYSGRKIKSTEKEVEMEEGEINIELGQAREKFRHGDKSESTGKSKKTDVYFRCCSESETKRQKGSTALYQGEPVAKDTTIASITNVWKDPEDPRKYILEICTPILCEDTDMGEMEEAIFSLPDIYTTPNGGLSANEYTNMNFEHLSLTEILDETLGEKCLYSKKDGWWQYEYCHKQYVRQFSGVAKYKGIDLKDDTQHLLGFYKAGDVDQLGKSYEWEHVVNVTDEFGQNRQGLERGGNGSYLEVEYPKGELCLLEDAKASDTSRETNMERSVSVRYSCALDFSVSVQEDSTCHYVAEITLPPLCRHPLFRPLVQKQRSIKCLPIEDELVS